MSCCCCFVWTWGRRRRGGEREEGRRRERERGDFEGERRPGKIRIYHFPSTRRRRRLFGCVGGKAAELDIWKVCAVSRLFASGTTFCPPTLSPRLLSHASQIFLHFPFLLRSSAGRSAGCVLFSVVLESILDVVGPSHPLTLSSIP